jgi:hypothetical protein
MAASSRSAGTGDDEKPPFTFEQIVLRFGVSVIIIVLFVTAVELGGRCSVSDSSVAG